MAESIFKLRVENSEYDSKLKKAAEGIQHLAKVAHDAGGSFTNLEKSELDFIKALGDMNTVSKTASGSARELETAYKNLAATYNQLSADEKADEGGKALAASLEKLRERAIEARASLDDATNSLKPMQTEGTGTSGVLSGLFDKMTINIDALKLLNKGLGAASSALSVAKDAFFANENALDEWGRTVSASESLYHGFLNALNNSDISGFLSKMDDIVEAAKAAYNAMDDLNTYNAFMRGRRAEKRSDYSEALNNYKLNPTAENKQALAEANKALVEELRTQAQKTRDTYEAELKKLGTERGLSGKQLDDFVTIFKSKNYEDLQAAKASYSTGRGLNIGSQYYYGDKVYDGRTQDRSTGLWRDLTQEEKAQFEFARALSQVNDKQIDAVQALDEQYRSINDQINNQNRSYNRLSGNNGKVPGSGTTTTPAQQAANSITTAEQEYARALEKAALEVQGGTITEAQQKQKQLQATEALWTAYGKASDMVNGSNADYKAKQAELGQRIVELGGETKSMQEAQKQAEEAYRQVAAQTQKLANAQEEANKAISSSDLKAFYAADKKITAAGGLSATTGMDMSQVFGATTGNIDAFIGKLKERIASSEVGTDLYNALTAQLADASMLGNMIQLAVKNGVDMSQFDPKTLWTKIFGKNPGDYIDDAKWEEIRLKLEKIIGKPITIDVQIGTAQQGKGKQNPYLSRNEDGKMEAKITNVLGGLTSGVSSMVSGLEQMGVEIPEGIKQGLSFMQGITSILTGIATTVLAIEALTGADTFLPFARGGIVHAANGFVPGNRYSTDDIPVAVSSGELILNRAQQGNLASQLSGGEGGGGMRIVGVLKGHDMALMLDRWGMTTGRGELLFGKNL